MVNGVPLVYIDLQDLATYWKEPQDLQHLATHRKKPQDVAYGVYETPKSKELWIDGSWNNAYGNYQKNDRNVRVEKAQQAFPTAQIHEDPENARGWNLPY
jgi:hypothetical protein